MSTRHSVLLALMGTALFAQTEYGPENGTLIIVGGGNLTGTGIMRPSSTAPTVEKYGIGNQAPVTVGKK